MSRPPTRVPKLRLAILLLGAAGLLGGLDAALLRLGVVAPVRSQPLAGQHGILMVYGFLATAIALERAIGMQAGNAPARWAYLSPVAGGLGTVLMITQAAGGLPASRAMPGFAWALSMLVFCVIYVAAWRRQPSRTILVQLLAAVAGLGGIVLWVAGFEVATIVPWWATLLVLTIIGERMELARVAFAARRTETRILAEAVAMFALLPVATAWPVVGYPLLGLALGTLMVDTLVHDVARRLVRSPNRLTRFMAASMLAGYGWALVAALVWVAAGPVFSGYWYDIVIHALTIGYALSMVVAHAPVIVPAIVKRQVPYHPVMWVVAGLLQAGLLVRVLAGVRSGARAWQFGGALSVVALLAFLVSTAVLVAARDRLARASRRTHRDNLPVDPAEEVSADKLGHGDGSAVPEDHAADAASTGNTAVGDSDDDRVIASVDAMAAPLPERPTPPVPDENNLPVAEIGEKSGVTSGDMRTVPVSHDPDEGVPDE